MLPTARALLAGAAPGDRGSGLSRARESWPGSPRDGSSDCKRPRAHTTAGPSFGLGGVHMSDHLPTLARS